MPSPSPAPLMLTVFPTFAVGGAQARFVRVAAHLGPRWRHAIIAMDCCRDCADRLPASLDVTYPDVAYRKGQTLANLRSFRNALATLRPELLVTSNWGSIEWVMANALPLARHIHIEDGFGPDEQSRQIPRRVWMRRLFLRRARVVLPSRNLVRIAQEQWRLPRGNIRYIPNGIDLSRFIAATAREAPVIPVIGTVAALRPEKNLARLMRAFALLLRTRKARLEIVGDGVERAGLEALARDLGIGGDVVFHGHSNDAAAIYRGFDVFALSSDTEQMPLSVLEAMATGLAIVATDVGDVRAMLATENEPAVVAKDEGALATMLARMLDDHVWRATCGVANRAKAEREFDEHVMFAAYDRVFAGRE